ncbi:MAG: hypothetical protein ACXVP5_13005, partial [Tumebacillaceae bacterium]
RHGVNINDLLQEIADNAAFASLNSARVRELIEWMLEADWLEVVEGKCILGVEGEKLVRSRDFYAVFQSPKLFKVMHGTRLVGTIEQNPLVLVGEALLLAGGMWTITDLDEKRGIVYVTPAFEGKKPIWLSGTRYIHPRIAEKIYDIYTAEEDLDYLSPRAWHRLKEVRMMSQNEGFTPGVRIVQEGARTLTLFDFAGTRRQNAMATILRGWLRENDMPHQVKQSAFSLSIEGGGEIEKGMAKKILTFLAEVLLRGHEEKYLLMGRGIGPERGPATKFAAYLPMNFQRWIEDEIERDVEGLREWMPEQKWKVVRL